MSYKVFNVAAVAILLSAGASFASTVSGTHEMTISVMSGESGESASSGYAYDGEPPAVPLPAAGLMLLAGLGGLAAVRRFKRG